MLFFRSKRPSNGPFNSLTLINPICCTRSCNVDEKASSAEDLGKGGLEVYKQKTQAAFVNTHLIDEKCRSHNGQTSHASVMQSLFSYFYECEHEQYDLSFSKVVLKINYKHFQERHKVDKQLLICNQSISPINVLISQKCIVKISLKISF